MLEDTDSLDGAHLLDRFTMLKFNNMFRGYAYISGIKLIYLCCLFFVRLLSEPGEDICTLGINDRFVFAILLFKWCQIVFMFC